MIDDFPCYELWSLQATLSALLTTHPRSKGQRPPPTGIERPARELFVKERKSQRTTLLEEAHRPTYG